METIQNVSKVSDPWLQAQATEAAIRAHKSLNGERSLKDYQPTNVRQDPAPIIHSPEPVGIDRNSPDYIPAKNRLVTITKPEGTVVTNPFAVSATPLQTASPAPRPVPTAEQVREELESLKKAVSIAEDNFESDKASRPAIHARMAAIGSELGPLVERVRALESELIELKAIPTSEAAFTASVAAHEFAVQQAAGHALEALQENWAQHIFGISFRRNPGNLKGLSDSSRDDINLGLAELRTFINRHQVSFGLSANKTVEAARNTLKRLSTNLNEVAALLKEKLK